MVKIKSVVTAAIVGFALSFLISLFCTWGFGISLLRGIIFAVVFALLATVIDFVYDKFLDIGGSDVATDSAKSESVRLGGKVDISIDDADLTDDGQGLSFAVSNNRQGLWNKESMSLSSSSFNTSQKTESSLSSSSAPVQKSVETTTVVASNVGSVPSSVATNTEEQSVADLTSDPFASKAGSSSGFQPISLGKPLDAKPANSESNNVAKKTESSVNKESSKAVSDLNFVDNKESSLSAQKNDNVADTNFVEERELTSGEVSSPEVTSSEVSIGATSNGASFSPTASNKKASNDATEHDAETLAKAIRTVLKQED